MAAPSTFSPRDLEYAVSQIEGDKRDIDNLHWLTGRSRFSAFRCRLAAFGRDRSINQLRESKRVVK